MGRKMPLKTLAFYWGFIRPSAGMIALNVYIDIAIKISINIVIKISVVPYYNTVMRLIYIFGYLDLYVSCSLSPSLSNTAERY